MNKKLNITLYLLLFLIIIILGIYCFNINKKLSNEYIDNCAPSIYYEDETNIEEVDCTFTQTYNIVNLMDNYIAEVPEYSYVIVDKFQAHSALAHKIPTTLKETLEVGESYEFTYHLKGKVDRTEIIDIYDIITTVSINHLDNDNLSVTLKINKTDKEGLEQVQEPICINN